MRVLIITNLFPNQKEPRVASFNRQQFAALGRQCRDRGGSVEVLATTPWFPGKRWLSRFAEHKTASDLPEREEIDGLPVRHPKTLHLPKIGVPISAPLFTASLLPLVREYRGKVDVVLGSWAHPDGCAAIAFAKRLGVPCAVKLHGTDINNGVQRQGPRQVMKHMLPKADAIFAVSSQLGEEVHKLGVPRERIHLLLNGVDAERFAVRDRGGARQRLGLPHDARIALCVGNLIESKGVFDLLEAFAQVASAQPNAQLYFVGGGNAEGALRDGIAARGLGERVHLVGSQPFEKIPDWMSACDLLVLPSHNEGTPNVVLEALAAGRRVVASRVGGVPDVVHCAELGAMVEPKQPSALAAAVERELSVDYDAAEVARIGSRGSWDDSAARMRTLLRSLIRQHPASHAGSGARC